MREREIVMKMIHMYILLWIYHLKEAEDGMGYGVGWLLGRWGVVIFFFIFLIFCVGCIRRRRGLPIY